MGTDTRIVSNNTDLTLEDAAGRVRVSLKGLDVSRVATGALTLQLRIVRWGSITLVGDADGVWQLFPNSL